MELTRQEQRLLNTALTEGAPVGRTAVKISTIMTWIGVVSGILMVAAAVLLFMSSARDHQAQIQALSYSAIGLLFVAFFVGMHKWTVLRARACSLIRKLHGQSSPASGNSDD